MAAECKEAKKVMMQGIRNGILLYFCDFFFEKSDEKKDRYIYIGIGEPVPSRCGKNGFPVTEVKGEMLL